MAIIYTTITQLAAADLARYRKQYTTFIPEVPSESNILELEIVGSSPRGAVVFVNSPDGFGPAHRIKLKRSDMQGDIYLGTYHKTKQEALLNIANYHIHRIRINCDDMVTSLDLPHYEYATYRCDRSGVDPIMAWKYIEQASMHLTDIKVALLDMYTKAKEAKDKRLAQYRKIYDDAPKGKLMHLSRDLDNDTFYLSLVIEEPIPEDPINSALNRDTEHRLIRATRLGSGFRYMEMLGVYDRTANWYEVKLTHEERFSDQWSTAPDAFWMETLSTRKQQEF